MGKSNFYNDLIKNDFFEEKTASENSDTKDMLTEFSTDQIEAIAEELGILFEKKAGSEEKTAEGKVNSHAEEEAEDDRQDAASQAKAGTTNAGKETKDERNATKDEKTEENKTKAEKEDIINDNAKAIEQKVAGYTEEQIMKVAYEIAEEKFASVGLSVADYVFSKVANEEIAIFVADKAEKLAFLTDQSILKVADDILGSVADSLNGSEE